MESKKFLELRDRGARGYEFRGPHCEAGSKGGQPGEDLLRRGLGILSWAS